MSDHNSDAAPVDPMADPSLSPDPPGEPEAISAAEQMNDPDGFQPGADAKAPTPSDDDPLPEPMQ